MCLLDSIYHLGPEVQLKLIMIPETDWTLLENTNRGLLMRFEKLKKARQRRSGGHQTSTDGVSIGVVGTLHQCADCRIGTDAF